MSSEEGGARKLRREFDDSFREIRTAPTVAGEHFLCIRIADDPFAIRVSEIAGLFADRPIVSLPSPEPAMLGLARFRSAIAPVYDLRRLLGYSAGPPSRWLVLVRAPALVALSFDLFEAHVSGIVVDETLTIDGEVRPLVQINNIVSGLRKNR